MDYKKKWWKHSVVGVTLIGLGVNFVAEATLLKGAGEVHIAVWFWVGLIGIASLNAGVAFMCDAVKNRIYLEMEEGYAPVAK